MLIRETKKLGDLELNAKASLIWPNLSVAVCVDPNSTYVTGKTTKKY